MLSFRQYNKIVVCPETSKFWFVSDWDFCVKENQYSIEYDFDGTKSWFLDGNLHREDEPAIECSNGTKYWYLNGLPHRQDGPAVEYFNGSKRWYFNGKELSEKEFKKLKNV